MLLQREMLIMKEVLDKFFNEHSIDIKNLNDWIQELKELNTPIPHKKHTQYIKHKRKQEIDVYRKSLDFVSRFQIYPDSCLKGFGLILGPFDGDTLASGFDFEDEIFSEFSCYQTYLSEMKARLEKIKMTNDIPENEKKYFLHMQSDNIYKTHTNMSKFIDNL